MAKIAVTSGDPAARPRGRLLARGEGWAVSEVVCNLGPRDRTYEEQHSSIAIAMVTAGSFEYRSRCSRELMTPGSFLLGTPGQCFECAHEHGVGDRCISFSYAPEFFKRVMADAAGRSSRSLFRAIRLPALAPLSSLAAAACAACGAPDQAPWAEISIELAARAIECDRGVTAPFGSQPGAIGRIGRLVRMIDAEPQAPFTLADLAREARLSPYHFLRTFQSVTGVTPHQYLLRMRLRRAAVRLATELTKVVDIALECGFGDVSNFNRAFRGEFGASPRVYRTRMRRGRPTR